MQLTIKALNFFWENHGYNKAQNKCLLFGSSNSTHCLYENCTGIFILVLFSAFLNLYSDQWAQNVQKTFMGRRGRLTDVDGRILPTGLWY